MSIATRIPTDHKQVSYFQSQIMRSSSPYFAPPVPSGMREPGTNWITIITATGPHTTEAPGVTGGMNVPGNKDWRNRKGVPPLTRKGG